MDKRYLEKLAERPERRCEMGRVIHETREMFPADGFVVQMQDVIEGEPARSHMLGSVHQDGSITIEAAGGTVEHHINADGSIRVWVKSAPARVQEDV